MKETEFLKSAYNNPTEENLSLLIEYLQNIGGKTFKIVYLRENLFKVNWKTKENKIRNRCQIQSAKKYLQYLENQDKSVKKKQVQNSIADLCYYVNELDQNEYTSFIAGNSNIIHSAIHFHSAKNLFKNHQILESHQDNYMSDLLIVYALRLSLEKRIRAILGIDYATTNNKKIGLSYYLDLVESLENIEFVKGVNWKEIKLINNWANHFMHRHIRPYPWTIYEAIQVLEPLLNPKEPLVMKNGTKKYSLDGSAYVTNESKLEKEIDEKLITKFPEIKIKKLRYREAVIDDE